MANTTEDIIDSLDALMAGVRAAFNRINSGGCGVMATIIGRALAPYVDEVRFAVSSSWSADEPSFEEMVEIIKENHHGLMPDDLDICHFEDCGMGFSHVWCEFRVGDTWWAVDCENVTEADKFTELTRWPEPFDYIPLDLLEQVSYNRYGWNTSFDRDQIPQIEDMVYTLIPELLGE
jgi:hypothetical protein